MSLCHEIEKTAGSGNQNVASFLKLLTLDTSRGTAINDTRTQHGAIAQTTRFIKYLSCQLSSGADDQNQRLCSNSILPEAKVRRRVRTRSSQLSRLAHQLGNNRNEEGPRLSRAYENSVRTNFCQTSDCATHTSLSDCNKIKIG